MLQYILDNISEPSSISDLITCNIFWKKSMIKANITLYTFLGYSSAIDQQTKAQCTNRHESKEEETPDRT